MSAEKRRLMQLFLRIPTLRTPMCNTLWRLRDSGHIKDRQVVSEDMAFDTITRIHCLHAHPGKNKTFDFLREEYYGITKEEISVIFFL